MRLPVAAVAIVAVVVEPRPLGALRRRERGCVQGERLLRDAVEADPLNRRPRSREAALDHLAVESDGFEYLRAVVRRHGRDAHLGHDLEQLLVDGLDVRGEGLLFSHVLVVALVQQLPDRRERQVGVERARAVADEQGELVHLPRVPHLRHERRLQALPRPHEVMVHGAYGKQHRRGGVRFVHAPVAQDDRPATRVDGALSGGAHLIEHAAQPGRALSRREQHGYRLGGEDAARTPERRQLLVHQDRRVQPDERRVLFALLQEGMARAQVGVERHHQLLAVRVDGRVRHLCEPLPEVAVQQPGLVRQHGERGVVAERAHRFDAVQVERPQHEVRFFRRVSERPLHGDRGFRRGHGLRARLQGIHLHHPARQPLPVRLPTSQARLYLLVAQEHLPLRIHGDHLAGAEPPLLHNGALVHVGGAHLRGHDADAVLAYLVTRGAQAVAVQRRCRDCPVRERKRRRAVPRLHEAGVVLVEGAEHGVHVGHVLPRLRHQHRHRVERVPAGHHEQLQHVVQARRIAEPLLDDGQQVGCLVAPGAGPEFPRTHPVAIALERVDLAVVPQHPERLGQLPLGESVRAVALVQHREGGRVVRVVQVAVERLQLRRDQHALVDDRAVRERGDVRPRAFALHGAFSDLPREVEAARERLRVPGLGPRDQHMLDPREGGQRLVSDDGGVHRRFAPAQHRHPAAAHRVLYQTPGRAGVRRRKEYDADSKVAVVADRGAEARGFRHEEGRGYLRQHSRAVTRLRVSRHRAPVRQVYDRFQRLVQHVAALVAVDVRNEADPARVVFETRVVQCAPCCRIEHRSTGLPSTGRPSPYRMGRYRFIS